MFMLKEGIANGIFSRSLPAKKNKIYTFVSLTQYGQILRTKAILSGLLFSLQISKMHSIWAYYPSAQPASEPQT